MRTCSVRSPRASKNDSSGARLAPSSFCVLATSCIKSPDLDVTEPATMSEWPPMYLVAEWIATSTPGISRQRWWKGVANVESHMMIGRVWPAAACASVTRATASRSVRRHVGFAGDSVYTTLVLGRSALRYSSGSVASTNVYSMPHWLANWTRNSCVPPYTVYGTTAWSPDLSTAMSAPVMADMPDEKSIQPPSESGPTPSSAASCRAAPSLVGDPHRP
mmetsp:Transcript_15138/g.38537  ORF Transcript_15138/g.38537 Transcript_15138/m.38537 type:complete len:219 (-) Transcript_15138:37-693(-)